MPKNQQQYSEEDIEEFLHLIFDDDPFVALGIHAHGGMPTDAMVDDHARQFREQAFDLAENEEHYEKMARVIENSRLAALRICRDQTHIEEVLSEKRIKWYQVLTKSIYKWSPWLVALIGALIALLSDGLAQMITQSGTPAAAVMATTIHALFIVILCGLLLVERRFLSVFTPMVAALPVAGAHFGMRLGWFDAYKSSATGFGTFLVLPFAGYVGVILALWLVRVTSRESKISDHATYARVHGISVAQAFQVPPGVVLNERAKSRAFMMAGCAAAVTLGLLYWGQLSLGEKIDSKAYAQKLSESSEKLQELLSENDKLAKDLASTEIRLVDANRRVNTTQQAPVQQDRVEFPDVSAALARAQEAEGKLAQMISANPADSGEREAFLAKIGNLENQVSGLRSQGLKDSEREIYIQEISSLKSQLRNQETKGMTDKERSKLVSYTVELERKIKYLESNQFTDQERQRLLGQIRILQGQVAELVARQVTPADRQTYSLTLNPNLVTRTVCEKTGLLHQIACGMPYKKTFHKDEVPEQYCQERHRR